jgi:hypothetical protein
MANVKFSDLTAVADVAATDLVAVSEDTGGGTFSSKKATASQVADYALGVTAAKGRWVEISRATASASATIDFTGIDSTYDEYMVTINRVVPATNDAILLMRTSTNNGSSYDDTASDYEYSIINIYAGSTVDSYTSTTATSIKINEFGTSSTASNGGLSGSLSFFSPATVARFFVSYRVVYSDSSDPIQDSGFGVRMATGADVDAIRFLMSTGNIASGTFVLLGRKK